MADARWISGRGEQEGRRKGRKKKHQHYSLKKSRDFSLSLVYFLKSEISDQATSDTWEMEGSSVQNYKKTNPPAPTTGVGRTSSNKPWMGYTPRVPEVIKEWLHSTHFPFCLYPLAGKGPLCPPEVFLHFQLSSFSIWREGTHTKRRQTDRQTGGGGVVFRTATIRPKVSQEL